MFNRTAMKWWKQCAFKMESCYIATCPLSALVTFNVMNWPEGAAISRYKSSFLGYTNEKFIFHIACVYQNVS